MEVSLSGNHDSSETYDDSENGELGNKTSSGTMRLTGHAVTHKDCLRTLLFPKTMKMSEPTGNPMHKPGHWT